MNSYSALSGQAASADPKLLRLELAGRSLSVERMLIELWRECFRPDEQLSLVAVGGFGRAELYPHSDVDVLILLAHAPAAELRARIEQFLAMCWSLKVELASSVRTVEESLSFALEDLSFITSLLDLRLLVGEAKLVARLQGSLSRDQVWSSADFFAAKVQEQRSRHQRYADTAYNLEPNLKEGPGGLRDLHTIRWVAQRHFGVSHWPELEACGFLEAGETAELEGAERVLSQLRFELHSLLGRREDRLLFDHQIRLAEKLGFVDRHAGDRAVEQLMQRYFRAVRQVQRMNEMLLARFAQTVLQVQNATDALELDEHFTLRAGLLELREQRETLSSECVFAAFVHFQARAEIMGLSAALHRQIGQFLRTHAANPPPAALFAPALLDILAAPERVAETLAQLARTGVLAWLLPAFERVTGRMQYDLFHAYTVDQHTLFVLAKLEESRSADSAAELPLPVEVWQRIRKPELLFLAALFHDIAKGRGGDHSELGAHDARAFCLALGLAANQAELVAWLVEQHLMMSTTAQKRDIQDPEVVRKFAAQVSDRERLDHLYLLTVADIRGTNPKLWNGWKARLLGDLYSACRYVLRRGLEHPVHASERARATREATMELLAGGGAGRAQVQRLWLDFPESCFLRYSADELRFQSQAVLASARMGSAPIVAIRPISGRGAFELFVRVADRDGLFATIAGVLDRLEMSVLGARIATSGLAFSHNTFQLQDLRPDITTPRGRALDVQMALQLALQENPLKPRVTRRAVSRQQRHFQFAASLEFVADPEHARTTVALVCADRPGLLARVALVFHDLALQVHSARIATFGERVEDFFQLSNAAGCALDGPQCVALELALRESLQPESP